MHLFDTHCHLQDDRMACDVGSVISRATDAGVTRMMCCGSSENDWEPVLELSRRFSCVVPALGIHPWYAGKRSGHWRRTLELLLRNDPRIAVGEIGLDHAIAPRDDRDQAELFESQLELARELDRPVSLHCRKAWGDLMGLFRKRPGLAVDAIIHSYGGPAELVDELQRMGVYISFSGSVTFERNLRGRTAAVLVSDERLLVETDSPDIPPFGHSGPNEPAAVVEVAAAIAKLRGTTPEAVASLTFRNGVRLLCRHSTEGSSGDPRTPRRKPVC